jgi:hypothetical protein
VTAVSDFELVGLGNVKRYYSRTDEQEKYLKSPALYMEGAQFAEEEASIWGNLGICQMLNLISHYEYPFPFLKFSPPAPDSQQGPIERSFETGCYSPNTSKDVKQMYPDPP